MARKTKPSTVASQLDWSWETIMQWSADLMEDANFHNISGALEALAYEDYDEAVVEIIKDEVCTHSRWSVGHDMIFRIIATNVKANKLRTNTVYPSAPSSKFAMAFGKVFVKKLRMLHQSI